MDNVTMLVTYNNKTMLASFDEFLNQFNGNPLDFETGKDLKELLEVYVEYTKIVKEKEILRIRKLIKQQITSISLEKGYYTRLTYTQKEAMDALSRYNLHILIGNNEDMLRDALNEINKIYSIRFSK